MWDPEKRHGLIDGDIIRYSCAYTTDKANHKSAAFAAARDMMLHVREAVELDSMDIWLSSPISFRKLIDVEYKAHRPKEKPKYFTEIKDYMVDQWGAAFAPDGFEADDMLGIDQTGDRLICTIDKDLDQIPGWHYNWKKYQVYYVSEEDAARFVWYQMVTGDTADNVFGVYGLGVKKTAKALDPIPTDELPQAVYDLYVQHGKTDQQYNTNYRLLKICTDPVLENNWDVLNHIERNTNE